MCVCDRGALVLSAVCQYVMSEIEWVCDSGALESSDELMDVIVGDIIFPLTDRLLFGSKFIILLSL